MSDPVYLPDDWWPRPLPDNVVVGERSYLYSSFAFIHYRSSRAVGVRIGNDSGVYEGTVFDLGPQGEVVIGDFATVVAPTFATNGRVVIGDYSFISNDVYFADGSAAVPPDAYGEDGETAEDIVVGENSWIGARAVLLRGAHLGEGAIVGAGAIVNFPVPPFAIVAGNPARIVGSSPPRSQG